MSEHPVSPARYIYLAACKIADPNLRSAYLDDKCGIDTELRQQLNSLLDAEPDLHVSVTSNDNPLHQVLEGLGHASGSPHAYELEDTPGQASTDSSMNRSATVNNYTIDVSEHPVIGRYKLLEELGSGGMGAVYMAQQTAPVKRKVALKIIKPGMDSAEVIARFQAERQALAMMDHPNIARVLDAGTTAEGRPYFVMELVRGIPITKFCEQRKLSLQDRLKLFIDVSKAVQHAHQKAIIHRDLKPSNILVTLHDGEPVAKVIDFGVAKALNQDLTDQTLFTQFSQMIGTPLYMSPEQAEMSGLDVDTRSDIYSLGVVLYELLTGTTPIERESLAKLGYDAVRKLVMEQEADRPSLRISTIKAGADSSVAAAKGQEARIQAKQLNSEVDWIVMKALEKDRTRRYETANGLAADVQRYLDGEAVQACPPSVVYRLRKFSTLHKSALATALLVMIAILIGTTVSISQAVRATEAESVAKAGLESERTERLAAQAARRRAEQAEDLAKQNAAAAYRQQYRAEMLLAQSDLQTGNLTRLYQTIASHLPTSDRIDLRGWEWDYLLARCQEGRVLCEHYYSVSSIDWSPDGQYLATVSYDGDACVWNASSGILVRRFSLGHTLKRGVAWSPDSQRLAWGSVGSENAIRIWDRRTDLIRTLHEHTRSLISIAWSHNGKRLATTSMDSTAKIWDTQSWSCLHTLKGHAGHVEAACWTPDDKRLITIGDRGLVKVWDAVSGSLKLESSELQGKHLVSASLNFSTPPKLLLVGSESSTLADVWQSKCWIVDPETLLTQQEIPSLTGDFLDIEFSPDESLFATAGSDGRIMIWDSDSCEQQYSFSGLQGRATSLAWHPNGNQIAAGCSDGSVRVWSVPAAKSPIEFSDVQRVSRLEWLNDDEQLRVVGDHERILWSTRTQKVASRSNIAAPGGQASLSPNGRLRAVASETQEEKGFAITIESVASSEAVTQFAFLTNNGSKPKIAWSPDSKSLVAFERKHLEVWKVSGGRRIFSWEGPAISDVKWANDNQRLAIAGGGDNADNGTQAYKSHVHVFDVQSKTRLLKRRFDTDRVTSSTLAWRDDGLAVAAGNQNGVVCIWDIESGREATSARPHNTEVEAIDWNPDGTRIASVAADGTLKIWNPLDGNDLFAIEDYQFTVVSWSSDGQRLAAAGKSGKVRIWSGIVENGKSEADQRRELAHLHVARANLSIKNEDLSQAIKDFTQAIELAPSLVSIRRSRAIVLMQHGNVAEALADLGTALEIDSENSRILRTRLAILAGLGRWEEALGDAVQFDEFKQSNSSRYWQAVLAVLSGDRETYRTTCLKQLTAPLPLEADSENRSALTCALLPGALQDYTIAIERYPESGALLYRAERIEEAVTRLTEEQRVWEQAGSVEAPGSPHDLLPGYSWYFLAMACHDLGRYTESQRWFSKAADYTKTILAQPNIFLKRGSLSWHQRAVLELLQIEAREKLGVEKRPADNLDDQT